MVAAFTPLQTARPGRGYPGGYRHPAAIGHREFLHFPAGKVNVTGRLTPASPRAANPEFLTLVNNGQPFVEQLGAASDDAAGACGPR